MLLQSADPVTQSWAYGATVNLPYSIQYNDLSKYYYPSPTPPRRSGRSPGEPPSQGLVPRVGWGGDRSQARHHQARQECTAGVKHGMAQARLETSWVGGMTRRVKELYQQFIQGFFRRRLRGCWEGSQGFFRQFFRSRSLPFTFVVEASNGVVVGSCLVITW